MIEKLRQEEPLLEARIRALEEQKAMKMSTLQVGVHPTHQHPLPLGIPYLQLRRTT